MLFIKKYDSKILGGANIEESVTVAGINFRSYFSLIDLESEINTRIFYSIKNSDLT